MKKIGMLVFIVMMMAVVTAVQAEVRAGGLPPLVMDDRISDGKAPATAPVRAGGLPVITVDKKIKDCDCRMFPSCCAQPAAAPVPVKEKVTISLNVQFDSDKAVVKEKYHDDIKRVANFMKEFPNTNAEIGGHTDSTATNAHNQKLSEERAKNVRQYIIDKFGIDGSRLTAKGYGEDRPIASNNTEEGKQKNRRVEAVLETVRTSK
jgi:outer membrane protein OmpA-like peptidoglycan-associated protein